MFQIRWSNWDTAHASAGRVTAKLGLPYAISMDATELQFVHRKTRTSGRKPIRGSFPKEPMGFVQSLQNGGGVSFDDFMSSPGPLFKAGGRRWASALRIRNA